MDDLEEEFLKLVNSMYQQVQALNDSGELSNSDAGALRHMIATRVNLPTSKDKEDNSWCNSSSQDDDDDDDDDGWKSSSLSC